SAEFKVHPRLIRGSLSGTRALPGALKARAAHVFIYGCYRSDRQRGPSPLRARFPRARGSLTSEDEITAETRRTRSFLCSTSAFSPSLRFIFSGGRTLHRLRSHVEHAQQERPAVGGFLDDLGDRLASAVAGFGLDADENR